MIVAFAQIGNVSLIGSPAMLESEGEARDCFDIQPQALAVGQIGQLVYDGQLRNVRIEQVDNAYIKCFDLNKNGYRTFTFDKIA